jgi:branched-chain amino acid transport system ATP-binding protein
MIRLEGITAAIGPISILRGIDLHIAQGELVVVLGANGAGKTTLLRVISGLLPPTGGSITFDAGQIKGQTAHDLARMGLVHVPQGRQIIPTLTVEENLALGASHLPGITTPEIASMLEREYARFPVLKDRRSIPGGSLSGGEQQMLAVSRGLMMRPKVLMLDEPSLGLSPQMIHRIMTALAELSKSGMSVLLVEQKMAALDIADRAYVLKNGSIVRSGPAAELRDDPAMLDQYLH